MLGSMAAPDTLILIAGILEEAETVSDPSD